MIVAYPPPKDIDALGAIYHQEHVAVAVARLEGKTKILATKVLQSPEDTPSSIGSPKFTFLQWKPCSGAPAPRERRRRCQRREDLVWRASHHDCGRGYL